MGLVWPNLFPWNGSLFRSIFHRARWSKLSGPPVSFNQHPSLSWVSLVPQMVKNLPGMQETWVQPLSQEDCLEKGMATHSSILAGRILWSEEPGWLQSMGLQRVRHGWLCTHTSLSADSADPETTIGLSLAGWSLGVGTLSHTAHCPQARSRHLRSMETSVLHQDQAIARRTVIQGQATWQREGGQEQSQTRWVGGRLGGEIPDYWGEGQMAAFSLDPHHWVQICRNIQRGGYTWMGGEFGGEIIHVYVWLSRSAVHLKLSQQC